MEEKLTLKKWVELCNNYGIFHYIANEKKGRVWMMMEDDSDLLLVKNILKDFSQEKLDFHPAGGDNRHILVIRK